MAYGTIDVYAPKSLIIPTSRTSDGKVSGAYVNTGSTTGAIVMSGAKLFIHTGAAWAMVGTQA